MRRSIPLVVAIVATLVAWRYFALEVPHDGTTPAQQTDAVPGADSARIIEQAWRDRRGDLQVAGEGIVQRVLADDVEGDRHQRFVLELATGQTLLVAHNIDLAPRIENLATGDRVRFYGEYEWNEQGGVLHWTHSDPAGRHPDGWLEHDGRRYQ